MGHNKFMRNRLWSIYWNFTKKNVKNVNQKEPIGHLINTFSGCSTKC